MGLQVREKFEGSRREDYTVLIGRCQRMACLLELNPNACIQGLEDSRDGKKLDIIIGLQGPSSKPEDCIRADTDILLGTLAWCQIRAQSLEPQMKGLISRVAALVNSPLIPVHRNGQLTPNGLN